MLNSIQSINPILDITLGWRNVVDSLPFRIKSIAVRSISVSVPVVDASPNSTDSMDKVRCTDFDSSRLTERIEMPRLALVEGHTEGRCGKAGE